MPINQSKREDALREAKANSVRLYDELRDSIGEIGLVTTKKHELQKLLFEYGQAKYEEGIAYSEVHEIYEKK